MTNKLKLSLVAAALCGAGILIPSTAHAKKPGVLEGKPIVVDRLELRKFRVQITPEVGMSLSQPYVHKGFAGANLRFDITDWLGIRGKFDYGVINVDSKLLKALNDGGLPCGAEAEDGEGDCGNPGPRRTDADRANPAPLHHDMQAGLTRVQWQGSAGIAFTPFSGKLGLFSAIFTEYDIYIFGGVGFNGWQRHYPDAQSTSSMLSLDTDPNSEAYCVDGENGQNEECLLHPVKPDEGVRVGGSFGGGIHLFLTEWAAVNLEVEDVVVGQNDAGLNATIDDVPPRVENKSRNSGGDRVVRHNVVFNLGVTFYLPPRAKRSKLKR